MMKCSGFERVGMGARLGVDGTVMLVGSVLEELKGARHDGNARGASISSLGAAGPRELGVGRPRGCFEQPRYCNRAKSKTLVPREAQKERLAQNTRKPPIM